MTELQKMFEARAAQHDHGDMLPHMMQLHDLASMCRHVTEFGVRTGQTTIAIAAGLEKCGGGALISYDINDPNLIFPKSDSVQWEFRKEDTAKIEMIEATDMLFIDTLHNDKQVEAELRQADFVRNYIVLHDVYKNAVFGEEGDGLLRPIFEFLADKPEWGVLAYHHSTWGMLVLSKNPNT